MTSSRDNLVVAVRQEQRSVSICEERVVMWPMEEEETGKKQALSCDRKASTTSFFNPAINFARRMSLRITGNRGEIGGGMNCLVNMSNIMLVLFFANL